MPKPLNIRPPNAMISVRQVCELTTLSHVQLYRLIAAGKFPQQVRIGPRRVAFHLHEVDEWIASRERVQGRLT